MSKLSSKLPLVVFWVLISSGIAAQEQVMTVWGNTLGIHGHATLALVNASLHLQNATVVGEGTVLLQSNTPQSIVSENSRLTNLTIRTEDTVTLYGELLIEHQLSLEEGVFDTRPGELSLSESAELLLTSGAELLWPPDLIDSPDNPAKNPAFFTAVCSSFKAVLQASRFRMALSFPLCRASDKVAISVGANHTSRIKPPPEVMG